MIRPSSNSWQWSGTDRCLVWLGLGLAQYVSYAVRIGHLLALPDVEPYFSRPVLAVYRAGLVGLIVTWLLLLVYALMIRRRRPDHLWLPYAVIHLYFLWIAVSAYVVGPLTTPSLGLMIAAVFMSALLFARAVVVAGLASALLLLAATTLAERARRHLEDLAHVARLSTMGEMAAGLAHELNQPLTAVANYAFIGQHTVDSHCAPEAEPLRALFKELSDQALRAGDIVLSRSALLC